MQFLLKCHFLIEHTSNPSAAFMLKKINLSSYLFSRERKETVVSRVSLPVCVGTVSVNAL